MADGRMTKRQIRDAIFLSTITSRGGYRVHHIIPGEQILCEVPMASIGHAIVRALRERQFAILEEQKVKALARSYVRWGVPEEDVTEVVADE